MEILIETEYQMLLYQLLMQGKGVWCIFIEDIEEDLWIAAIRCVLVEREREGGREGGSEGIHTERGKGETSRYIIAVTVHKSCYPEIINFHYREL